MNSINFHRDQYEYKDLQSLDADEFHYALPYEFHIRAEKERYKEYLSLFYIDKNDELNIKHFSQIVKTLATERDYILNLSHHDIVEEVMRDMLHGFFGIMGNNGVANPYYLYVDYHFFTDEEKKIAKLLKELYTPKIINEWERQTNLPTEQYVKTNPIYTENNMFVRIDKKTKINHKGYDDMHGYNYEQSYDIRYKRPKMFAMFGNKKTIKQEININLPREVILKQLERIIDIAKEDNKNILSASNKAEMACYMNEPEIINQETKEFYKKRTIIDTLFAYDYFSIREVEIKQENRVIKEKLQKRIEEIKNNFLYDTAEKKEQITIAKAEYKKKINDDIYNEIQELLYEAKEDTKTSDAIKKIILQVKKLIEDKNYEKDEHYLNFINGI